jgi:hypothetical protein
MKWLKRRNVQKAPNKPKKNKKRGPRRRMSPQSSRREVTPNAAPNACDDHHAKLPAIASDLTKESCSGRRGSEPGPLAASCDEELARDDIGGTRLHQEAMPSFCKRPGKLAAACFDCWLDSISTQRYALHAG